MERQKHGFNYEALIIEANGYVKNSNYTDKWDAFDNNTPVSVKCIKNKGSIDFGDFKRKSEVNTDFILCIGFWSGSKTNIINEYKVLITKENWTSYLGDINIITDMMEEMKSISNDRSDDGKWKEFRLKYGKLYGQSILSLRFKRDHKTQKRIQCGISFKNFTDVILKENVLLGVSEVAI